MLSFEPVEEGTELLVSLWDVLDSHVPAQFAVVVGALAARSALVRRQTPTQAADTAVSAQWHWLGCRVHRVLRDQAG